MYFPNFMASCPVAVKQMYLQTNQQANYAILESSKLSMFSSVIKRQQYHIAVHNILKHNLFGFNGKMAAKNI